jgi:hypothetical protein
MANYLTIITPIEVSNTERCRQYLRDHAEPGSDMRCGPNFQFDLIPNLHFSSFVILEAADDFKPNLVFEATFDGSKADFLSDLLRVAGNGMDQVYGCCAGYPASGLTTPELIKEYLIGHDAGAHIYFSGNPGRIVAEIKGESGIRSTIVSYFSQLQDSGIFAPRLDGIFSGLRGFVAETPQSRWAEQPIPLPWEVKFRHEIAVAVIIAALIAACLLGAACDWVAVTYGHAPLLKSLEAAFAAVDRFGGRITGYFVSSSQIRVPSELFLPIGLAAIWILLRGGELFLSNWSKHPRDQLFYTRVPLHIAIILRYGALVFLTGAVLLALIPNMGTLFAATALYMWLVHIIMLSLLLVLLAVLVYLKYLATTLKISVELKALKGPKENWRRLELDLVRFAMMIDLAGCALIISRYVPSIIDGETAEWLIYRILLIAAYGLIGVLAFYAVGVLLLMIAGGRELLDRQQFADPALLVGRSGWNASRYAREEGGNNRYQNHLASLTRVKPGFVHAVALRGTLFIINLLSRFWFNVGTLGDIPTILSARWVLIDRGRRLLFLDNYGGAWNSYLNEFIDMAAVKGLNAIWTNTFVESEEGARCSFPWTQCYFWKGAQAELPFKAYVRESQIETIVWYSAYPFLSVVNINRSTAIRRSLSNPLTAGKVDAVVQDL